MGFCSSCGEIVRNPNGNCQLCKNGKSIDSATSGLESNVANNIADKYANQYLSAGFKSGINKGLNQMLNNNNNDTCNEYCLDCQRHITKSIDLFIGPTHLGGHVYCETCYGKQFSKGFCKSCNKPVLGLGKEYVQENNNNIWHKECYEKISTTNSCYECNKIIYGQGINALSHWYHPECFKCFNCTSKINGNFVDYNGNPCCKLCNDKIKQIRPDTGINTSSTKTSIYNDEILKKNQEIQQNNNNKIAFVNNRNVNDLENLCDECLSSIKNEDIVKISNGTQYHKNCLKCNNCNKNIDDLQYILGDNRKIYHPKCKIIVPKVNGNLSCKKCNLPIKSQFLKIDGSIYHPDCFTCVLCNSNIGQKPFGELPGRGPACEPCLIKPTLDKKSISSTSNNNYNNNNKTIVTNVGGFTINPITGKREERLPGGALKNPPNKVYGK